jgi:hypothetical protein
VPVLIGKVHVGLSWLSQVGVRLCLRVIER